MPTKAKAVTQEVEEIEPVEPTDAAEETPELSVAEKVKNLTIELYQVKLDKKESNKTFNEEVKRIEAEIKDLLKSEGELEKE